MFFKIVIFAVLLSCFSLAFDVRGYPCLLNEEYSCGNPYCEETCRTIGAPCHIYILRCEDKCYCKDGYVRIWEKGPCILKSECYLY